MRFVWVFPLCVCAAYAASYDYVQQGADWPDLCATGTRQSPIDIVTADIQPKVAGDELLIHLDGNADSYTMENNGHTISVAPRGSPHYLTVNGTARFDLLQYHLHAPSEHTFDGVQNGLGLHIVHINGLEDESALAVVLGVTFVELEGAAPQPLLQVFIDQGDMAVNSPVELQNAMLDVSNLIPTDLSSPVKMVRYEGSLTTPPCSEHVTWFLFTTPISIPPSQMQFFTNAFAYPNTNGNYRVVDPAKNPNPVVTEVDYQVTVRMTGGGAYRPVVTITSCMAVFVSMLLIFM